MFKKVTYIAFILLIFSCGLSFSQEKSGQVIGSFEKTNEKVSLNGVFLDVYKTQGKDAIIVEELTYCGYDMDWNSKSRITTLIKNDKEEIDKDEYNSMNKNIKGKIYSSDIKIYIEDRESAEKMEINAYNIGGYSLVYLDELKDICGYIGYIDSIKLKDISGTVYLPNKEKAPKGGIDVNIQTYHCFPPYVNLVDEVKVHIKEGENSTKYTIKGNRERKNIIYFYILNTNRYYNSREEQLNHSRSYEITSDFNSIDIEDKSKQDILISRKSKITGVIHLQESLDRKNIISNEDTREFRVRAFNEYKSASLILKKSLDDKDITFELEIPKDFNKGKFNLQIAATTYEGFSQRHYMGGPIMVDSYYKDDKLVDDIEKAQVLSIKDLDNLKIDINMDKPIGKEIGIVHCLNGKLGKEDIRVFNIKGKLGVKVSDLNRFGYNIDFDNTNKRLDVKSNNSNTVFKETVEIKGKELTNSSATYTNINTYLDNKQIDGFNIDSSMVVLFKDLKIPVDLNGHIVTFDDVNLEKAIREIINKYEGDIYLSDLNKDDLTSLDLSSKNITNLKGIENISNLRMLKLNDNNIKNLSCLSSLKNLYYLELNNNDIEDIYPLKDLNKLNTLKLSQNNIIDISVLQNLTELRSVDLSKNDIKDVKGAGYLINAYNINLSSNEIEDISSLSNLKNINTLALNSNKIKDVLPLANINKISRLELSNNQIEDISPLKGLTTVARLDLGSNNIKDISAIEKLTNLYELTLNNNKIDNVDALSNIKYLYKLYLNGNEIKDDTPVESYYKNLKDKDF